MKRLSAILATLLIVILASCSSQDQLVQRDIEFRSTDIAVEWKYSDEDTWTKITDIVQARDIEFRTTDTAVEWKYSDEDIWTKITDIDQQREVEFRTTETAVEWKYTDEDIWIKIADASSDSENEDQVNTSYIDSVKLSSIYNINQEIELDYTSVKGVLSYYNDEYSYCDFTFSEGILTITSMINLNTNKLEVITNEGIVEILFDSIKLERIVNGTHIIDYGDDYYYVYIPANHEEGFHFGFILGYSDGVFSNSGIKHILMDTSNEQRQLFASNPDISYPSQSDITNLLSNFMIVEFADRLNMPFMMPIIPRIEAQYYSNTTGNVSFYETAMDRDTIFYNEILNASMYGSNVANIVSSQITELGYNEDYFKDIDEQVVNMIAFAREYLADNGIQVEQKVFFAGHSASGSFGDRFSVLQPQAVRAVYSGVSGDDYVIPSSNENGLDLILPLGVYDYKTATGREFSIDEYNSVARIIQNGELDNNDVFNYSSTYGLDEKTIAYELWGDTIMKRNIAMVKSYRESGAEGLVVMDLNVGHGSSPDMIEYTIDFFLANLGDNTEVVYPNIEKYENLVRMEDYNSN